MTERLVRDSKRYILPRTRSGRFGCHTLAGQGGTQTPRGQPGAEVTATTTSPGCPPGVKTRRCHGPYLQDLQGRQSASMSTPTAAKQELCPPAMSWTCLRSGRGGRRRRCPRLREGTPFQATLCWSTGTCPKRLRGARGQRLSPCANSGAGASAAGAVRGRHPPREDGSPRCRGFPNCAKGKNPFLVAATQTAAQSIAVASARGSLHEKRTAWQAETVGDPEVQSLHRTPPDSAASSTAARK
mmetsp:Transcript_25418/g.74137  ORF Transcript_25418/g.74137 Transcript_25418/m.74137 type:complete len:242 (-) Transcript_25418:483-1208(-)